MRASTPFYEESLDTWHRLAKGFPGICSRDTKKMTISTRRTISRHWPFLTRARRRAVWRPILTTATLLVVSCLEIRLSNSWMSFIPMMISWHKTMQIRPSFFSLLALETTDAIISELESELQRWLQTTPDFFHPKTGSLPRQEEQYYDTPWILKRQQRTVQVAFFFAKMLIYRGPLLRDFRRQEPNKPPTDPLSDNAKKCAESALAMVALASEFGVDDGKYNGTFWITSHFVFCAISILLVYLTLYQDHEDRFVVEKAVDDAMAFHRKLDNSVNISAQKLLDESRYRAHVVQNIKTPGSSVVAVPFLPGSEPQTSPQDSTPPTVLSEQPGSQNSMPWRTAWPPGWDGGEAPMEASVDAPTALGWSSFGSTQGFDMIMDIGFDNTWYPDMSENNSSQLF
ncbi:hypothetical protein AUP68_00440 [Ilyonectria robusta]